MAKTLRLTGRPSSAGGSYEGYTTWLDKWINALIDLKPFKTGGSWSGSSVDGLSGLGQLATSSQGSVWTEALRPVMVHVDYVVWSYWTPIAFHVRKGDLDFWVIPEVTYSRTTSRQQSHFLLVIDHWINATVVRTVEDLNELISQVDH